MKLRLQGQSLRIRVSRSELARFVDDGKLEETFYFGPAAGSDLTYSIVRDTLHQRVTIQSSPGRVQILIPAAMVRTWSSTEQVGIEGQVHLAVRGKLSLLVEKDFACIDRSDAENADTFPNPHLTIAC